MQKHLVRPQFATGFQKAPFGRRTKSSVCVCVCVCVCVFVCDRAFSMFSHRKIAESSGFFCSVIFLGWRISFEPNFEAQLALEVPQRAFRPPFSDPSHSRDGDGLTLPGRPSTLIGCRPRIDAVLSPVFGK